MKRLSFIIPRDCSGSHLRHLMEPRRQACVDARTGAAALTLGWNGTLGDRETARAEVAAALVEEGSRHREVAFIGEDRS
jgi:hypothetical protein